jgi:hypothetical protein
MNQTSDRQFARFDRQHRLPRRSRRRQAARVAMKFAIENREQFPNQQALLAATKRYLQSGQRVDDAEYGSFVVSFVIGPIIAWVVGQVVQWVWDNWNQGDAPSTQTS